MATCELELSLDDGQSSFVTGGSISGAVRVRVDDECPCQQLSVALVKRATKRGQVIREDRLPPVEGDWSTSCELPLRVH